MNASDNGIWLGLLKWSMQYNDGTQPSNLSRTLSPEDKLFLERVMKESIKDEVKVLTQCYEILQEQLQCFEPEHEEQMTNALIEIQDITEQIDMARTFLKIGGPNLLLRLILERKFGGSVRKQAAICVSTICQNNIACQDEFIGEVRELIMVISDESENAALKAKVLGSISAIVRNHLKGFELMRSEAGVEMFKQCLGSGDSALRSKAVFLMKATVMSDDDFKDRIPIEATTASRFRELALDCIEISKVEKSNLTLARNICEFLVACIESDAKLVLENEDRFKSVVEVINSIGDDDLAQTYGNAIETAIKR
mmetsp:Transcript_13313/g.18788  ORF Transcript_13313/g.18788 Transcript_13313/m.18788 type:complete len:311 (+) Transcript_13313:38-970(+)